MMDIPNIPIIKPLKPVVVRDKSLQKALTHIDEYWSTVTRQNVDNTTSLIGLPNAYIIPSVGNNQFHFNEQYYWDSYFTAVGMYEPKHQDIVEGMLENLIYLFNTYGMIPNASRMYMLSRSQPPILTSFIFLVYERYRKPKSWLKTRIEIAKKEYQNVWMGTAHPYWHKVHQGLSRYYDINVLHDLAEAESGWDMTPRFQRKALDYLPIDLNCLLYKYEADFARAANIAGELQEEKIWLIEATKRRAAVNKLMWGKIRAFYFDYNYQKKELGNVWSLAGYYALWSGLASEEQAKKLVVNLKWFNHTGGLSTTSNTFMLSLIHI